MLGEDVTLPDPTTIFPFLGLFTLVVLQPGPLVGCDICTCQCSPFFKTISSYAPSPSDENVARMFDVLEVARENPQISLGLIPLTALLAAHIKNRSCSRGADIPDCRWHI